jgi:D-sedoheptulose 7-phosphate isomerase
MKDKIRAHLKAHFEMDDVMDGMVPKIESAADILISCYKSGGKVLLCGNGGSAADAQHFAAELVGRFMRERKPLPAIALTTNTSTLTALANDYGYENVFSRQVDAHLNNGDVLVCMTTSGNSKNLLKAMKTAKSLQAKTVTLNGKTGGELVGMADTDIVIPGSTPRIQEMHIMIIHIICDLVEAALFPDA